MKWEYVIDRPVDRGGSKDKRNNMLGKDIPLDPRN